jgi:hypothetical protein
MPVSKLQSAEDLEQNKARAIQSRTVDRTKRGARSRVVREAAVAAGAVY